MMELQMTTEKDRKEAKNRERRRQCELERRSRIFNARNRKIGIDVEFLTRQLQEKKELDDEQNRRDLAIAKQMIKDSDLAVVLEARKKEEQRCMLAEIDEFRRRFQRKEDAREYDLNDPDYLKKQLPPRPGEKMGLSAAQHFAGTDENYAERQKIVAAQKTSWLEQQLQEKRAAEEEMKKADAAYMAAIKARDARALELDRLERECRRRVEQAAVRYNETLSDEKRRMDQIAKEQEQADNTAEVYNTLTSDLMTENPEVAKSCLGGNKAIGFMYKGMTPEELKKFREEQREQVADLKAKREVEMKLEAEWEALSRSVARQTMRADIAEKRTRREMAVKLMEENQLLALAQKEKKKYYEEVYTKNTPTEAYYEQFNTTTR